MDNLFPFLTTVLVVIGSIIAAGIPIWLARKRYPSQKIANTDIIVDAAEGVVGILHKEFARIEEERQRDRREIDNLRDEVYAMRAELGAEERKTDKLQQEVNRMKNILSEYRRGVGLLIRQLYDLGHTPAWQPKD